jgi:hypothetical protein
MSDIIKRLERAASVPMPDYEAIEDGIEEIKRLRGERDEARRMVCEWHGGLRVQHPQDYAKRRGWDCYKEDGK